MIHFSIPLWLFGTVIGMICFGLLAAALAIGHNVRRLKSRKGLDAGIANRAAALLNNHFQHNLLGMQVDAVFNSLIALIETERIRLKTLVAPSLSSIPDGIPQACHASACAQVQAEPAPPVPAEPEDPPADFDDGPVTDRCRAGSGLSKAERELVEKMRRLQAKNHRKLEAVV